MRNMIISTKNKNLFIKCEQKQPKNQKPQKSLVQKFQRKCMKNVILTKKKG